jgi:hypothetical protein
MRDRLSFMALLMFYSLSCLSFFRISPLWIPIIIDVFFDRLLSFSKLPEYQCRIHFWQYRIAFVWGKNVKIKVTWPHIDHFQSFHPMSMSLSVSYRGWSPGFLVPRSEPYVHHSPLPVYQHSTSLLDLHLTINHHLGAPHLRTTSQETCCITQLTSWLAHRLNPRHKSCWQSSLITHHNRTTRTHVDLVFTLSPNKNTPPSINIRT